MWLLILSQGRVATRVEEPKVALLFITDRAKIDPRELKALKLLDLVARKGLQTVAWTNVALGWREEPSLRKDSDQAATAVSQ